MNRFSEIHIFGQVTKLTKGLPGKKYEVIYLSTKNREYALRRIGGDWVDKGLSSFIGKEVMIEGVYRNELILCNKISIFNRKTLL